jgi:hypothetical protein
MELFSLTNNIIRFPLANSRSHISVAPSRFDVDNIEQEVRNIKTRHEYLKFCKNVLDEDDYIETLCGIMDEEIYEDLEPEIQRLVDAYFIYEF